MKRTLTQIFRLAFLGAPLVIGMIGLLSAGEPFVQAFYRCLRMYIMEYDAEPANILVEIARWWAVIATAGGVMLAINLLGGKLRNFLHYLCGNSVAVYGPENEQQQLLDTLGRRGIVGKDKLVRAHRYILLNSEEENFEFYTTHLAKLKKRPVYLKCQSLPSQSASDPNLRLFCPEETAARIFWKENFLYPESEASCHQMKIVFLGFGRLGEELLLSALQNNIFSPNQRIEYHIFGNGDSFTATHTQLTGWEDSITFHSEPWYDHIQLIARANRVIVLTQENQLALLKDLLLATTRSRIDVFAANTTGIPLLAGHNRLQVFDWQAVGQKLENILGDLLYERAKRINLRYANLYGGVEETDANKEAEWNKLDTFTRYSNISSADYHEICLMIFDHMGLPHDAAKLTKEQLELFAELEHIRWCRYHYLNNWRQGIPANGKNKDAAARIHKDLIPFGDLTDGEKEKDRENIRVLLSIP